MLSIFFIDLFNLQAKSKSTVNKVSQDPEYSANIEVSAEFSEEKHDSDHSHAHNSGHVSEAKVYTNRKNCHACNLWEISSGIQGVIQQYISLVHSPKSTKIFLCSFFKPKSDEINCQIKSSEKR